MAQKTIICGRCTVQQDYQDKRGNQTIDRPEDWSVITITGAPQQSRPLCPRCTRIALKNLFNTPTPDPRFYVEAVGGSGGSGKADA